MTGREKTWLIIGVAIGALISLSSGMIVSEWSSSSRRAASPTFAGEAGPSVLSEPIIHLTSDEQDKIGLETSLVHAGPAFTQISAPARVEEIPTAIRTIPAPSRIRIDHLYVTTVGEAIARDQPLALINESDSAEATSTDVILRAPSSGILRTLNVGEGRYASAGEVLMTMNDLGSVLVRADLFESDIGQVQTGLRAQITSEALKGLSASGVVSAIDSRTDPQNGTTPVRAKVDNPGMRLKPGMLARMTISVPMGSKNVVVPRTAVIDAGTDTFVYLTLDKGGFQRRMVRVRPAGSEMYAVLGGLAEGDRVVTNGAFMIDAQARLTRSSVELAREPAKSPLSPYRLSFQMRPAPAKTKSPNRVSVTLVDEAARKVNDAQVEVWFTMPAMPSMGMPEMRHSSHLEWDGSEYSGSFVAEMAGQWNVVINASRRNQLLSTLQTRIDAR